MATRTVVRLAGGAALVHTTWVPPATLEVVLTDGQRVWTADAADPARAGRYMAAAGLARDEYLRLTRAALTPTEGDAALSQASGGSGSSGARSFTVRADLDAEPARLRWQYDVRDALAGTITVCAPTLSPGRGTGGCRLSCMRRGGAWQVTLGDLPLEREPDDRARRTLLHLVLSLSQEKSDFEVRLRKRSAHSLGVC
jgi:hypothetical protein